MRKTSVFKQKPTHQTPTTKSCLLTPLNPNDGLCMITVTHKAYRAPWHFKDTANKLVTTVTILHIQHHKL